ncbi:MAG: hypothetical protein AVDCRST_MAG07-2838, partial [uncultured Frankineae bacterium]
DAGGHRRPRPAAPGRVFGRRVPRARHSARHAARRHPLADARGADSAGGVRAGGRGAVRPGRALGRGLARLRRLGRGAVGVRHDRGAGACRAGADGRPPARGRRRRGRGGVLPDGRRDHRQRRAGRCGTPGRRPAPRARPRRPDAADRGSDPDPAPDRRCPSGHDLERDRDLL